jgi:hypothetical protein
MDFRTCVSDLAVSILRSFILNVETRSYELPG